VFASSSTFLENTHMTDYIKIYFMCASHGLELGFLNCSTAGAIFTPSCQLTGHEVINKDRILTLDCNLRFSILMAFTTST
jgi:hypothetical protein